MSNDFIYSQHLQQSIPRVQLSTVHTRCSYATDE